MKVIILAAGMGTRLGTLIPKPLTAINNEKTILDLQVEKLARKIGIDNIYVVVGYKKELIMEKHSELIYIYNSNFAKTNTAKSLLCALKKIEEDVIFINGDVFFEEEVIDLLLQSQSSCCLVDTKKCADEEIKYTLNEKNNIFELSKNVKHPQGEAVGINLIKKSDLELIIDELQFVLDDDYFEKALENLTMLNKLKLKPVNIQNYFVKEIDFYEDLIEVKNFINTKKEIKEI